MAGAFEHIWFQKDCDVKRCMRVGKECDTIIASLLPQYFTKVERLEGDGGVGTVRLSFLNPDVTGGEEKVLKEKTLVYDEENGDFVWEVVEDPKFIKLRNTMKVTPAPDVPTNTKMFWKCEYELADPGPRASPPKEVEIIHHAVMKALMHYVDTHPDWP